MNEPRILEDSFSPRPVSVSRTVYEGMVWNIGRDTVDFAPGVRFDREYVDHTGAVAILGFTKRGEAILINQYRHPVGATMWEIPAGLLDHEGEDLAAAAERELAEETGYSTDRIHHLIDMFPSPGGSTEMIRIFVAFDCTRNSQLDFVREHEESEIEVATVDFEKLRSAVLAGSLTNGTLIMAVLAFAAQQQWGDKKLGPRDLPLPNQQGNRLRERSA